MRVLAGALKGRKLVTPKGDRTRPTADQVRIALMDTLMPWLPGARVLDLFAGAGGVGFEALSRGASHVTFVERDAHAVAALRANVVSLEVRDHVRIHRGDVARALGRLHAEGARFDIIFLDPPYEVDVSPTLMQLGGGGLITPGGVVIAQHLTKKAPAEHIGGLLAFRTRRFGETTLSFYRVGAPG